MNSWMVLKARSMNWLVVGDPLAKHHHRVERLRVRHDDVLRAVCREEMGRPVRIRVLVKTQRVSVATVLSFLASFWESRKIIVLPIGV